MRMQTPPEKTFQESDRSRSLRGSCKSDLMAASIRVTQSIRLFGANKFFEFFAGLGKLPSCPPKLQPFSAFCLDEKVKIRTSIGMADRLLITVHGIRTFGNWQEKLESALHAAASESIETCHYKYGFFTIIAFMVPPLRWLATRRFRLELLNQSRRTRWTRIDIVAHSFGTHLVAWSLTGLEESKRPRIHTIILAGSVLKSSFPIRELLRTCVYRVVNECGIRDNVLLANQLFVLFTGMAGRIGLSGMEGGQFRNRYYNFGHSGYFLDGKDNQPAFMVQYWLPLLLTNAEIEPHDDRVKSSMNDLTALLLNNAEPIKLACYLLPLLLALLYVNGLRVNATRAAARELEARREADKQRDEAKRNLADALVQRGFVAADNKQTYKALVYLAEARRLDTSPRWNSASILAGTSPALRAGRLWLEGPIRKIRFIPRTDQLAVAFEDAIKIVDPVSGQTLLQLGDSSQFWDFVLDRAGTLLVARHSNEIRAWDLNSPKKAKYSRELSRNSTVAWGIALNAQTGEIAFGLPDGRVQLVAISDGLPTRVIGEGNEAVECLDVSPDGTQLAIAYQNSSLLQIWDMRSGRLLSTLDTQAQIVTGVQFSPDSERLAVTGTDGLVRIWDVKEPASPLPVLVNHTSHAGFVWTLTFEMVHSVLATGGEDQTVHLWDAVSGAEIANLEAHAAGVRSVAFNLDNTQLVAAYADGSVVSWYVHLPNSSEISIRHTSELNGTASFNPVSGHLALGATPGTMWADISGLNPYILRRMSAYGLLGQKPPYEGVNYDSTSAHVLNVHSGFALLSLEEGSAANVVAFNAAGTKLAGGGYRGILLWDPSSGKILQKLTGENGAVSCIAFSGNDERLAVALLDAQATESASSKSKASIVVWDIAASPNAVRHVIQTDELLPADRRQYWALKSLAFSPDGSLIQGEDNGGRIYVWDVNTGKQVKLATVVHGPGLNIRAINRDFSRIIVECGEGRLCLETFPTGEQIGQPLAEGVSANTRILVSPNWEALAVQTKSRSVELWDIRGQKLTGVAIPGASLLAFNPSSDILVTALEHQQSIAFWDSRTGAQLGSRHMQHLPTEALFNSTGSMLVVKSPHVEDIMLLAGSPILAVDEAEKLSGFHLNGASVEALPSNRERQMYHGISAGDQAIAEFWIAFWQVKSNLRKSLPEEAVRPLREWMRLHPKHPMFQDAPKYLEPLLSLPDTRRLIPNSETEG